MCGLVYFTQREHNLFKLVDKEGCAFVRMAWQLGTRWLRVKPSAHRILHVDALQWIRVPLVTALTALPHHGVAILLGLEDGQLSWRTDLALRHELGSHLYGNPMHRWVWWRTHGYADLLLCSRLFFQWSTAI